MSAAGDAIVLFRTPTPGVRLSRYRPAGGSWGAEQMVLDSAYSDQIRN